MWFLDGSKEAEDSGPVEAFIDKQYYRIMQVSALYLRMDPKNRVLSFLQLITYVVILAYHWSLLVNGTLVLFDINMVLFSQSVHFSLLVQLAMILPICFQIKHQKMYQFHKMLSYEFFDYEDPPIIGEDHLRSAMAQENRKMFMIPVGVVAAAGAVLIMAPIVDMNAGSFDFSKTANIFIDNLPYRYAPYPFPVEDGFGYYFALLGQMLCGLLLTLIIAGGGFLFLNLSQNVVLQLKILHSSLDNIEGRTEHLIIKLFGNFDKKKDSYGDSRYAYCYSICLRKNFEHHQIVVRAFKILEELASVPVFLAYTTGTIVIALSLISAGSMKELPGTTLASMILCGVEVGYMFLFSVFGQRLSDLSSDLRFKLYSIKWYLCNNKVKSNMLIFQEMTLKPLTMTVGGVVPANMETFSTVMNSAYSYYNLVNAFDGS
ncbi:odorant receptor 4 [Halyomorpha halys]|uniref:odorant receptor 4 n=1 Tax=Halyomorpha halys TaxID=286706 RepID=UPI0006D505DB|nr:uncharacterized protein LOC106689927 [Halyomorpha halys]KAE8573925.1 Odorant receptor 10 [Halyomorpha halys]